MEKIKIKYKIKGETYTVKFVKEVPADDACGLCDKEKKLIFIQTGMTLKDTELALLHEFVHASLYELGLNHLSHDLEEQLAEGLSMTIHKCFFEDKKPKKKRKKRKTNIQKSSKKKKKQ